MLLSHRNLQKVPEISVLYSIPAHIKFIQRYDIFREMIPYHLIDAKFSLNCILRCQ